MNQEERRRSLMSGAPVWTVVPEYLRKRMNDNYTLSEYDDSPLLQEFPKLLDRKIMFGIKNNYRSKLDEFVTRSGAKSAGMSNVNIVGLYQTGDVPKSDDIDTKARRAEMHENYAEAIALAVTDVAREKGFSPNSKGEYPDYDTAKFAIEVESLSSKGPYDRGDHRTAFTVEENNLNDAHTDFVMSDDQLLELMRGLERRREFYARSQGINKSKKWFPEGFAAVMERRGISGTYRGGFNASGNSTITLSQVAFSSWIFSGVKGLSMHEVHDAKKMFELFRTTVKVSVPSEAQAKESKIFSAVREHLITKYVNGSPRIKDGVPEWILLNREEAVSDGYFNIERLMTVDEFMSHSAYEMFREQKLTLADVIDACGPKLNIMGNLQRDQGSPFKYDWVGNKLQVVGRKDRKYRMVIPVMAWVQMFLIAACDEILDVAPSLEGRVGLLHPDVNEVSMRKYLLDSFADGCFNDSFDLTRFDAGIIDQMMNLAGLMYASLYDDPNVKCALAHLGWWSMDKYMILAKPTSGAGTIWDKYSHVPIKAIKGNKSFSLVRAASRTNDAMLKREAEAQLQRGAENDYEAVLLHVRRSWEPSGIFMTNTSESDINCAVNTNLVWLEILKLPRVQADADLNRIITYYYEHGLIKCQTSGDDIIIMIPIELLDYISLAELRELFAEAYKGFNWTMNASKMSKVTYAITYKGKQYYIPCAEFLQWLYFQNPDDGTPAPRRKFCRAWPSLGYTERNSKLPLPMQYTSVDGRLNTALTTNPTDLDFAANVIIKTGLHLKRINKKKRIRVKRSKGVVEYINNGEEFYYNPSCEAGRSELCGLDDYFSYVKQYGDDFIGELSKRFAELKPDKIVSFINDFSQELETRAPHRAWLVKSLMTKFSEDEIKLLFGETDFNTLPTVKPVVSDLVAAIEKLGVTFPPKKFPDEGDGMISDREVEDGVIVNDPGDEDQVV